MGVANAPIVVKGNVDLSVSSQPLATSQSHNFSVGVVLTVSTNRATVSVTPKLALTIGQNAVLTAGGTITLKAFQNTKAPEPEDGITFLAPSGVNTGTNAITLTAASDLKTGATITYLSQGGTPVGGLTNGNHYNVLVIDPTHVQLGSQFDVANADPATDTISFGVTVGTTFVPVNHNLYEGQLVVYASNGGGLNGARIGSHLPRPRARLLPHPALRRRHPTAPVSVNGSNVDGDGHTVNAGNSYSNGQAVQYNAGPAIGKFGSGMVDIQVDGSFDPVPNDPSHPTGFVAQDNDAIFVAGHGLSTGQQVVYSTTGGLIGNLADNAVYYVIVVNQNQIRLADSLCHATGTCTDDDDNPIPVQWITLNPDKSAAGLAVLQELFAPGHQPIAGLVDGGRYFVTGASSSGFQLETSPGGGAIALNGAGITGFGSFVPAIVDLQGQPGRRGPAARHRPHLRRHGHAGARRDRRRAARSGRRKRQQRRRLGTRRRVHRVEHLSPDRHGERHHDDHGRTGCEGHRGRRLRRHDPLERERVGGCLDGRLRLHQHRVGARFRLVDGEDRGRCSTPTPSSRPAAASPSSRSRTWKASHRRSRVRRGSVRASAPRPRSR